MAGIGIGCIVAATDFSPEADAAVRRAASLASSLGSVLNVLHVLPPRELLTQFFPSPAENEIAALRKRADDALQDRVHRIAAGFAVTPSWALFHGYAHRAILDAVGVLAADLVVVGARGEHEGERAPQTIGETALKLADRSAVPLLLVRREPKQQYHAVLACAKGERIDNRVIGLANEISPGDLLHVASAYTVPYEERLTAWGASKSTIDVYATREREARMRLLIHTMNQMRLPEARVQLHVQRDAPLQLILRTAAQLSADLIVVGRRASAAELDGNTFGSVSRQIAVLAPMDVLVVPSESATPTRNGVAVESTESSVREK